MGNFAALLIIIFALASSDGALAQQQESPSAASSNKLENTVTETPSFMPQIPPTVPAMAIPSGSMTISVQGPIKIEAPSGGSGGGLSVSGAVVAALISAAVGILVGRWNARNAMQDREGRLMMAQQELDARQQNFSRDQKRLENELSDKRRQFEKELALKERQAVQADTAEINKMSIEGERITLELKRLGIQTGLSDNEKYLAATKFVHEKQVAETALIKSLAEQLLGEDARARLFSLFFLSAYVSPDVVRRLAEAGDNIISTTDLEELSRIDDYQIGTTARLIVEKRKKAAEAKTKATEAKTEASPGTAQAVPAAATAAPA